MSRLTTPALGELSWIEALPEGFAPPAAALAFPFRQSWRSPPEAAFRPANAWLAATPDAFHIWASLTDTHPRTSAGAHHARLWEIGDVFEIFLQRVGDEAYHEFHVAPNGYQLQLRFPHGDWPRHGDIAPYIHREPLITSRVHAEPKRHRWQVRAHLPFAALGGADAAAAADPSAGNRWRVCFARYDYDDQGVPCCSASAPLTALDFHRRHEWPVISLPLPV